VTNPDPRHSTDPHHPAEAARPRERTGATGSAGAGPFVNPEAALGGADAVQKTSYVVGEGTDPAARHGEGTNAHPRAGGGPNYLAWGIGALAVLIAAVYLISLLA
jgi:hypothetical protein